MRAVCHIDIVLIDIMVGVCHFWLVFCFLLEVFTYHVCVLKGRIRLGLLLINELSWSVVCDAPQFFFISLALLICHPELAVACF